MNVIETLRGAHEVFNETYSAPRTGGVSVSLSHFEGYSPILDGQFRVILNEAVSDIKVHVNIRGSHTDLSASVKVNKRDSDVSIKTGGLSMLSSLSIPFIGSMNPLTSRLYIYVTLTVPKEVGGNVHINGLKLPIISQSSGIIKGDLVLRTESSNITLASLDCQGNVTCESKSGTVTISPSSELRISGNLQLSSRSGNVKCADCQVLCNDIQAESRSGSLALALTTPCVSLKLQSRSGNVRADIESSASSPINWSVENESGSVDLTLRRYPNTATVALRTASGARKFKSDTSMVKTSEGGWDYWKPSDGVSIGETRVSTKSGSINVQVS